MSNWQRKQNGASLHNRVSQKIGHPITQSLLWLAGLSTRERNPTRGGLWLSFFSENSENSENCQRTLLWPWLEVLRKGGAGGFSSSDIIRNNCSILRLKTPCNDEVGDG